MNRAPSRLRLFAVLLLVMAFAAHPRAFAQPGPHARIKILRPHEMTVLGAAEKLGALKTGDSLRITHPPAILPEALFAKRVLAIPERYYAKVEGSTEQVTMQAVLVADGPMRYDRSSARFRGAFFVILEEPGLSDSKRLAQPVSFLVTSTAEDVIPKEASIDHTNLPASEIRLAAANPDDSVQVRFITSVNPRGYPAYLQVEPFLSIEAADTSLQGFGIERATVIVSKKPPRSGGSLTVHLSATQGSIDPEALDISGGQAIAHVRSAWMGVATIRAISPDLSSDDVRLHYRFPFKFLSVTLIGGVVGGLVRMFRRKPRRASLLIVGVLWGLIVAVAWAGVGLNLLDLPLPTYYNEAVVFVLSSLAAFTGPVWQRTKPA